MRSIVESKKWLAILSLGLLVSFGAACGEEDSGSDSNQVAENQNQGDDTNQGAENQNQGDETNQDAENQNQGDETNQDAENQNQGDETNQDAENQNQGDDTNPGDEFVCDGEAYEIVDGIAELDDFYNGLFVGAINTSVEGEPFDLLYV